MQSFRQFLIFAALVCFVCMGIETANGQTSRGTVTGTITDPSGASVAGASVKLTSKATNVERETETNYAGVYRFDAVDLGLYALKVSKAGFRPFTETEVQVAANRVVGYDVQLEIGTASETIQVEGAAALELQTTEPLRGGNFEPLSIVQLPLAGLDPINLLLLLPGSQNARTTQFSNGSNNYSVNGQRARSNNFMIDGVENNDISVAGPAFQITNPDAIQEVSVQTSQFSAEFGRAGGAVVNEITKSGTNQVHGTAAWIYRSQVFNATSNGQRLGARPGQKIPPVFNENIPAFTIGGPVTLGKLHDGRNKTFFFAAGQWDRFFSTALGGNLRVPTDAGVAVLQPLAAACPNVALYLQAIGSLRGNPGSSPSNISIAAPSGSVTCNGTLRTGQAVQTGLISRSASQSSLDANHLVRIDHNASNKQTMSFRWLYDQSTFGPSFTNFDGFDRGFSGKTMTGSFTDTYVIRNNWTNEFRFNYGRIGFNFPSLAPDTFHANLPNFSISGITGFGVATNIPQFRFANNWQYQDTMSVVRGRHTFRFGVDFLRQLARQHPPFNERGAFGYNSSTGATGLANFIDDFGGSAGSLSRVFGDSVYHPNLFRQAYFVENAWKTTSSLTLTLGLRYENYGQPANGFRIPAFTNYSTTDFNTPNKVNRDDNNFAPLVGFAWNPHLMSGLFGRVFGNGKTVVRGGYQVSYDAFFNNLLSNIAGSSPNTLGGQITSVVSPSNPRGMGNFQAQFATITATPARATDPQNNLFDPNIRNPYTQRWSFGIQRELPNHTFVDLAYVGTVGHKLFQSLDVNPIIAGTGGSRLFPLVGPRTMRASSANSAYNALQLNVKRRYGSSPLGSFQLEGSYTWSHFIDTVSEVFGTDSTFSAFQSAPQVLGFTPNVDRGSSDNDRRHRFVLNNVWDVRGPKKGILGQILGYWSLGSVWQLETGAPFTVRNGTDRNGDGQAGPDRPEFGNLGAPTNTRAVIVLTSVCLTGFQNPDTLACVTPNDVHWVQGSGLPGANTAGRNLLTTPNFYWVDLNVIKRFPIGEKFKFEYRAEVFNLFNRQNFGVPAFSVATSPQGTFLDFHQTDALGRSMRMGLKLIF